MFGSLETNCKFCERAEMQALRLTTVNVTIKKKSQFIEEKEEKSEISRKLAQLLKSINYVE